MLGGPEERAFQANGPALAKAKVGSYEDVRIAGGWVKSGDSTMIVKDWSRHEADGT